MPDQQQPIQRTSSDADDCFLEAKARVEAWAKEFETAWFKPQVDLAKRLFWNNQPEEVKNELRRRAPQGAAKLDALVTGKDVTNGIPT